MWAERSAYRTLSRLCRAADQEPSQLVALLGRPRQLYNPEDRKFVRAPPSRHPFVDDVVSEASGGTTEYAHPVGSATDAVRRYYRRALMMGGPDVADMRKMGQRIVASRMVAMRLSKNSSMQTARPQSFAKELSALRRLPPQCRKPLRVGDYLITHPLSSFFQPLFDQAVIMLLRVDSSLTRPKALF